MSAELLARLRETSWHLAQIIPLPEGGWLAAITHDDAQLKLAYTADTRDEALARAVAAAEEGRRG